MAGILDKEIKETGKTWEGIEFMARDRQMWRSMLLPYMGDRKGVP